MTPVPRVRHRLLAGRRFATLFDHLPREPAGIVLASPADLSWGRDDVLVEPDVLVVEIGTPDDILPRLERETVRWHPRGAATALAAELEPLFAEN